MPLNILTQKIERALTQEGTERIGDLSELRNRLALEIAQAVDEYVQEQIGLRLQTLPSSILVPCPTPAGPVPTPPTPGPTFAALTRTR